MKKFLAWLLEFIVSLIIVIVVFYIIFTTWGNGGGMHLYLKEFIPDIYN